MDGDDFRWGYSGRENGLIRVYVGKDRELSLRFVGVKWFWDI